MTEPNTAATAALYSTGSVVVTLATVALGPFLGEYAIVLALGLLGTLVSLTEVPGETYKKSLLFIFKGVTFSLIFTGLITTFVIKYIPQDLGLNSYALLGAVSFSIGWTSNKWERIKDWLISLITKDKTDSGS